MEQLAFSSGYKRYALSIIIAVSMLNVVDRGLVTVLLQPIKNDLHLSDTQLGLLTGIVFGLFYATLALPIARLSDRGNRVSVTAAAIGLWGLTVMACFFVTNFVQLVFARIAAAVGEAGCKPPTYSLVGDYFPEPAERPRAMAIYSLSIPLSTIPSFMLGGWLNELYGWRTTFLLMGIPGLILAAVVKLTIVEPRGQTKHGPASVTRLPPLRDVLATLWRRQSSRHLSIALILLYTMSYGLGPWEAAFMIRSHGMGTAEFGVWMGSIVTVCGLIGLLAGGYVASLWFAENERGQMRMCAVAVAANVPLYVAFLMSPDKHQALIALIPGQLASFFLVGPVFALLQRLVSDDIRATTLAVVLLLANVIGMGVGPQVVGLLSDYLLPVLGSDSLRYAMLAFSSVGIWVAYHLWRTGRTVEADLASLHAIPTDQHLAQLRHEIPGPSPVE